MKRRRLTPGTATGRRSIFRHKSRWVGVNGGDGFFYEDGAPGARRRGILRACASSATTSARSGRGAHLGARPVDDRNDHVGDQDEPRRRPRRRRRRSGRTTSTTAMTTWATTTTTFRTTATARATTPQGPAWSHIEARAERQRLDRRAPRRSHRPRTTFARIARAPSSSRSMPPRPCDNDHSLSEHAGVHTKHDGARNKLAGRDDAQRPQDLQPRSTRV